MFIGGYRLSCAVALYVFAAGQPAGAANLPVACGPVACGSGGPATWVTSGSATSTVAGTRLEINQTSDKAVLNWAEFNIAAGNSVVFKQPSASSLALNKIFQDSPSKIFGMLTANGQIYLINQNGILFGNGAQVNVGSLVASSLPLDPIAESDGILNSNLLRTNRAAFAGDGRLYALDANGNTLLDAAGQPVPVRVAVEAGASIKSDPKGGGRLMLLGQDVRNAGQLESNKGQVILAAGQKIYVQASEDPTLRGLLVEVDTGSPAWNQLTQGGQVTNEATGVISTPQGNISLVGLAVNQSGRLSATTSVRANGSVRLLARDTARIISTSTRVEPISASRGGVLTIGTGSLTEVLPDATDTGTAVDDQGQPLSSVEMSGRQISMQSGSSITVPGGTVTLTAASDPTIPRAVTATPLSIDPDSQIRLEAGSRIDVSGAEAVVPVERNLVDLELRANELRDAPAQRDGALRGRTVTVDARIGTPLADVSGAIATIKRGVAERLSNGGTVALESQGDVAMSEGATIDVSGGEVLYKPGVIATSQLITADGHSVDISKADPLRSYIGIVQPKVTLKDPKWGVTTSIMINGLGKQDPGYVEGKDAGTVQFAAPALAVNGALHGDAVAGLYQRAAGEQPLGGRLVIGLADGQDPARDFKAPSVHFTRSVVPFDLTGGEPLTSDTLELPLQYLSEGGFNRTEIYSNGVVSLDDPLELAPGSSFNLQGDVVRVSADVHSTSGSLALTAAEVNAAVRPASDGRTGVYVADNVHLDMRGDWINDSPVSPAPDFSRPLYIDGGKLSLTVNPINGGELALGSGVVLNADGGAYLTGSGALVAGKGGQIGIAARGAGTALSIGEGLSLSAFSLSRGGSLNLTANQFEVVHGLAFATAQSAEPAGATPSAFRIGDSVFESGGFGNYSLTATGGAIGTGSVDSQQPLTLRSDSRIAPRMDVFVLKAGYQVTASGAVLADLSDAATLPDFQRPAANVSIAVASNKNVTPESAGTLLMETGAEVNTDAGGSVTFSASTPIQIDGRINAPAGSITVRELKPSTDLGYDPAAGIFVGPDAVLSVAGTTLLRPSDIGLRQGEVRDGGVIRLTADRGVIDLAPGSRLDVSGTQATLDLLSGSSSAGASPYESRLVASAGGSIELLAREGLSIGAELAGAAGDAPGGAQPAGGRLSIGVSRLRVPAPPPDVINPFPTTPRRIVLGGVVPGAGDPNGTTRLDPVRLTTSGFGSLALQADDRIEFAADVSLDLPGSIALQAPILAAADGVNHVSLAANTLLLGPDLATGTAPATASTGAAALVADARLIDLHGALALQGFDSTTLDSETDLRLTGLPTLAGQGPLTGSLDAIGTLQLSAQRLYPTTFTNYRISVAPDAGGQLDIVPAGAGRSSEVPLSAAGSLTVQAANITQSGAVFAPLGQLSFEARDSLTLTAGSITSTASGGQTIPFGQVQGGTAWEYAASASLTPIPAPPETRVSLKADSVSIASGATVDVSGGGDLYAYEFVPGPGGSTDKLSPTVSPGLFAILPSRHEVFATYDTQEYLDLALRPGDSVHLEGVPGLLAAGDYALLPARYALLPGAVLVQAVSGTRDLAVGSGASLPDGTAVVAGYREVAGTNFRDSRTNGFAIRPGSYARELAEYTDSFGNAFFTARAANDDRATPLLARDAGALNLSVGASLHLEGSLLAVRGSGGRGARVDLSAEQLRITDGSSGPTAGIVEVAADALSGLGAESILLGGSRTTGSTATEIEAAASSVTVANGARVAAPEVILVATDNIALESGAEVAATGTALGAPAQASVKLTGMKGGVLLRVSRAGQVDVIRDPGATASGDMSLAAGSRVSAPGSITVSAAGTARSEGTLDVPGGSLSLESSRIVLGGDPASVSGALTLSDEQVASVPALAELRLTAPQGISFASAVDLGSNNTATLKRLSLDTPNLTGAGVDARLRANEIELANSAAPGTVSSTGTGTGTGVMQFATDSLQLDAGTLAINGFASTLIDASADVRAMHDFTLNNAGDLTVSTRRVTGAPGSELQLDASGHDLNLTSSGAADSARGQIGAALDARARNITADTALLFPAGTIRLAAEQDLRLGANAALDVSGRSVAVGPANIAVAGGEVTLIARSSVIDAAAGSRVDVSAGGQDVDAGALRIFSGGAASLAGSLVGTANATRHGGSVDLYAGSVPSFGALADALATGGFTGRQVIELGSGDIAVESGRTISADEVQLAADGGSISVHGTIDARSRNGGSITLAARDGVSILPGADLEAGNTGGGERGGRVSLQTSQGAVSIDQAARVDVAGGTAHDAGTVTIGAPATAAGVAIGDIGGQINCDGGVGCSGAINGAANVIVAPIVTATIGPTLDALAAEALKTQLDSYMAGAPGQIRADLAIEDAAPVHIRPDLRVARAGDLTLTDALDLGAWRYDTLADQPGTLTLRATGNLTLAGNLSDGLSGSGSTLAPLTGSSWSYVLVAGADPSSVLPWSTANRQIDVSGTGDLTLAAGTAIRTGTGNMLLAAGRDVVLADKASLVYTVGVAARPSAKIGIGPQAVTANWLRDGGDIGILAGRDLSAAPTGQILSGWDVRAASGGNLRWAVGLSRFEQGVAALGGGNISVAAGRDISNLSATIPTTGAQRAGSDQFDSWGGGNLIMDAGRDLLSGVISTWRGDATVRAGRDIGLASGGTGAVAHTIVASSAGRVGLAARRDLHLEGAFNPTTVQPVGSALDRPYFFTSLPTDELDLVSVGGNLTLFDDQIAYGGVVGTSITPAFAVFPASLRTYAPIGDIEFRNGLDLLPSATGNLDIIAGGSVLGNSSGIGMSDVLDSVVPSLTNPTNNSALLGDTIRDSESGAIHAGDTIPVRVVAGSGDVTGGIYKFAKHFEVSAGRDVRELSISGQNLSSTLTSIVEAGRDLRFVSSTDQILLGGPGRLQVLTGRNVDLGFGSGIVTTGSTRNALLPSTSGADVDVWVGLGDAPDYPEFITEYFEHGTDYQKELVAYMKGLGAPADITPAQALAAFRALSLPEQRPLISNTFFNELRESGREANRDATLGFTRGFAAIESLFPKESHFRGDLGLVFSRIYTLAGGDINLLVPGGLVNVGLAKPPAGFSDQRKPSQLGMVAQGPGAVRIFSDGDVLVNQSRVFTLQGGDIVVWSSTGDIDAGRGAKSAVSAPPPVVTVDANGQIQVQFSDAIAGSGIRGILTREGIEPGDVDLDAPAGEVNAGDAGIGSAGNLNIAAPQVVGLDNIQVGGASTGVPTDNSGLASSLTGVSNVAAGASAAASSAADKSEETTSVADAAMGWLEVFVEGFGDKDEDEERKKK